MDHDWDWWQELSSTRGGGFGPAPISFRDIQAWAELTRERPEPWEVKAILKIDARFLEVIAKRDKEAQPEEKPES